MKITVSLPLYRSRLATICVLDVEYSPTHGVTDIMIKDFYNTRTRNLVDWADLQKAPLVFLHSLIEEINEETQHHAFADRCKQIYETEVAEK